MTLTELRDKLQVANKVLEDAHSSAAGYANAANRCYGGKGKTGHNGKRVYAPLMTKISFPNPASSADCITPDVFGNCKTDCCSKDKCQQEIKEYNDRLQVYLTAVNSQKTAQTNYDTFVKTDPSVLNEAKDLVTKLNNSRTAVALAFSVLLILMIAFLLIKKKNK